MQRIFLSAKLHKATVTHVEPDYDGSCAIDSELLEQAGILENEQIQIYNISNGERLTTYAIKAPAGSKIISVNGAAAHKANVTDRVIICAYISLEKNEIPSHKPRVVYLDQHNKLASDKPPRIRETEVDYA